MSKAQRWAWLVATVAATGAALVLAFLLSIATNNPALYERHFVWLFWLNVTIATLLLVVIGLASLRLVVRLKRGKFGSRLLLKLAAIFALVGVVPGLLIYTVSYQFVSRSIESWFDVRVETALDAGLTLGKGTLDAIVADVASKTRLAAERLGETPGAAQSLQLDRIREQISAQEIAIVGPTGQTLFATSTTAGVGATRLLTERPTLTMLRQARNQRVVSELAGLDEDANATGGAGNARVRALAFIPATTFALDAEDRYLLVNQLLPRTLAVNALAVQAAYREYQQRALQQGGLRKMYIGTLTLTLVLAVFAAVLLAATLGNQLARPLLLLAEGMRAVAEGDLSAKPVFASRDELGGLTRSFADMTTQLSDARALVQRSVAQLEGARANLQTILDNLTAGVIVFDRQGRIDTVNPGATRIMRLPLSAYRGQTLADVPGLAEFAHAVGQRFELHGTSPEAGERDQWQDSFELPSAAQPGPGRDSITLLVRGAAMPQGASLMVFDDITELVSAQRSEAWAEVARRLAHEIKNPLTPIQLSAERLQHKLGAKLEGADQAMLIRSVDTIVNQVQAMKTLVNEFRDYARLPAAQLVPIELNPLVTEVLGLYGAAQEAGELVARLGPALPAILGDGSQLRQVIHNLVQNGLDAVEGQPDGRVEIATEIVRNDQGAPRAVRLVVVDNGPGFSEKVLKRAFEPYVTTKSKGTGLGLAVVRKIADEHGARVRIANLAGSAPSDAEGAALRGARVSLSFERFAPAIVSTPATA